MAKKKKGNPSHALEQAKANLAMAKLMGAHSSAIEYWKSRVKFLSSKKR